MDDSAILVEELRGARRTLRIAVVTETYPPEVNGVAMTVGRLVEGLLRHGHTIQLVRPRQHDADHPSTGQGYEEMLGQGMAIPRYDGLRMGLPAKSALVRRWSRSRPDVVQIVTEGPLGWSALGAARKLSLPVVSEFHTNFHSYSLHYGVAWLKRPISAYLRRFHNRTDATFVPTARMRQELAAQGYRHLAVIARGVDTHLFNPARRSLELRRGWGAGEDDLVVMYVGRVAPEKNLAVLMRAFAAIASATPRARLVVVGDGPALTQVRRAHPQHHYAGMRSGEDLAAHYASGDLFLFPSLTETFGNVTLEAMASGLAVVAYDYAAASEVIRDGENGRAVPFDDETAFLSACRSLAADRERRQALGRAARQSVERLDWDHIAAALAEVLEHAVRTRQGNHADLALAFTPD
jgi:glycosyltransferase involved in cell wall biosynthesis